MLEVIFKIILAISIVLDVALFINYYIKSDKEVLKFYQIWMKGQENGNFFVMSGKEKRNKFVTDNGLVFRKTNYTYAILPFANTEVTYKDLKSYSEQDYLKMCLDITNFVYDNLKEDASEEDSDE